MAYTWWRDGNNTGWYFEGWGENGVWGSGYEPDRIPHDIPNFADDWFAAQKERDRVDPAISNREYLKRYGGGGWELAKRPAGMKKW